MKGTDAERLRLAESLRRENALRSERLVRAFATVPREDFLDPGPWLTLPDADGYRSTASADPRDLYRDVAVAIDAGRLLNNSAPGFLARVFDALDLCEGECVAHLGCGRGYYTAILAEVVGRQGRVIGVEVDAALARRARKSLRRWKQATVIHADALAQPEVPVDAIWVHAGVTHPQLRWLEALPIGGRLALPVTAVRPRTRLRRFVRDHAGRILRLRRQEAGFLASFGESCAIPALLGGRSPDLQRRLRDAFEAGGADSVRSLRTAPHALQPSCWLHEEGYCLSTRTLEGGP